MELKELIKALWVMEPFGRGGRGLEGGQVGGVPAAALDGGGANGGVCVISQC